MICSACPNLTNFEYKCISKSRYYVTTDIAWVSKDSTLCEEPKFQRLTYIKITVCGKMFHYDDKLEADMDTFKNYLSSKCPKLENPIQFKPYCVGTWKVGEFSSCDFWIIVKISPSFCEIWIFLILAYRQSTTLSFSSGIWT